MVLIERDEQLAHLTDLCARARRGQGQVALVTGAVAGGKSALLTALGEHVTGSGGRFLLASAARVDAEVPFGVMAQLFQGLPAEEQLAGQLTGSWPAGDQARALIQQQSCAALLRLAGSRHLVVAVDDIRHADPESLHCLLQLARRLSTARIALVLTDSPRLRPGHPCVHAELLRHPFYSSLTLPPLSARGVSRVLDARLGPAADGLAGECIAATGGNPLLVRAIVEDQAGPGGGPAEPLRIGDHFSQAVLSCLERHDDVVRQVARGLAVCAETASPQLLAGLLDMPPELAAGAIRLLDETGLVSAGRLRHHRIRHAVVSDMPPGERRQLHRRAAELLYRDGALPAVVATHLIEADCGDAPWAVQVLRQAADRAMAAGQHRVAAACLRLAVRSGGNRRDRAKTTAMLVKAQWQVSPLAVAGHLSELAQAVRADAVPAREALVIIPYLLWHGQLDDAVECLSLADTTRPPRLPLRRAAEVLTSWFSLEHGGDGGRPPAADLPDSGVSASIDPLWQAVLVLARAMLGAAGADTRGAEQILQRCELERATFGPVAAALAALICAGQPSRAANWAGLFLSRPVLREYPAWHVILGALGAEAARRAGDLALAREQASAALDAMPPQAWGVAVGLPLATILLAAAEEADFAAASRYLAVPVPRAMLDTPIGLLYLRARGRYHLATGRSQAALSDFQSCADLMTRRRLEQPVLVPWRLEMARAHLSLGQAGAASSLVSEQLRAGRLDAASHGLALRLLAATVASQPGRASLLTEAVELLERSDDRVELAHALADLGLALHAAGEVAQAAAMTARAVELSQATGARLLRCHPYPAVQPAACDIAPAGQVSRLSDAERRVATLAAEGHTNRMIAGQLYITVSTVEQHLTRIYKKLDIKSRADLPGRFPGQDAWRAGPGHAGPALITEPVMIRPAARHRPAMAAVSYGGRA
ncbi:MAG TPA: AAA family ATPase [Streptosporangiaceae bacterium]|jgi:DNA-binding CsgD family transcriptional regulator